MSQYRAREGRLNDWHLAHLGRFAMGGAGLVFVEDTAVERRGRKTHGCSGLWSAAQIAPLRRIARFLQSLGAAAGIQLGHAGGLASVRMPWEKGLPLTTVDRTRGMPPWRAVGPCAVPLRQGWPRPAALDVLDIQALVAAWTMAAARARDAGFDVIEIHAAHGFLLHQFLSPLFNHRRDAYGGEIAGRMRLTLEVAEAVRRVWPDNRPVFVRLSLVDGVPGGWSLCDSLVLARALQARGIDVIDCSAGMVKASSLAELPPPSPAHLVPLARAVKAASGMMTMAVGLIGTPHIAEAALAEGSADLIAIGRAALENPNWPNDAATLLGADNYPLLPETHAYWLRQRQRWQDRLPEGRS